MHVHHAFAFLVADEHGVVIAIALKRLHADVEQLHPVRRIEDVIRARLENEKRHLAHQVGRIDPALIPVHHVVPEDLSLRNAEEVVCRSQKRRRRIVKKPKQARLMHLRSQHPEVAGLEVVGLERVDGVVVARRYVHRIDHDKPELRTRL